MSSTNQSPEFIKAQKEYLQAQTDEERLATLEIMLKFVPKHKAGEAMRANLRTRYKKLKEKLETKKKKGKKGKEGIRKQGVQVVLVGRTNSGKSSLVSRLTNAKVKIASYDFTTKSLIIGTLDYQDVKFQIIDMPAVNYESFDQGLVNTADILLIVITNVEELEEIGGFLDKAKGKQVIVFNKIDLFDDKEKRKIEARLKSKRYDFVMISSKSGYGIGSLMERLFEHSGIIRIYTKEPGKEVSKQPVIMEPGSTIRDVAKKIFHKQTDIKGVKITGPSSKFPNQEVGLDHQLKDKDIVEFSTR